MGIYCRKCKNHKIPLLSVLANIAADGVRCEGCGASYKISGFYKWFYLSLEGLFVSLSVYFSFYFLTPAPLAAGIFLMFLARLFLAPMMAKPAFKNT